jgi:hypothetical protein
VFAPFTFRPQKSTPRITIELHQAVEPKVTTMRKLFRCERMPEIPRTPSALRYTLPTPATVLQPFVTTGPVQDQSQSIVFGKLSAEIRLLIYEAVLTDPTRLLHISFFSKSEGMGHWRCEDVDSPSRHGSTGVSASTTTRTTRADIIEPNPDQTTIW